MKSTLQRVYSGPSQKRFRDHFQVCVDTLDGRHVGYFDPDDDGRHVRVRFGDVVEVVPLDGLTPAMRTYRWIFARVTAAGRKGAR